MLRLSDLIEVVKREIGDRIENDEWDPCIILQINGMLVYLDDVSWNGCEIVLKPRMVPGL